MYIHTIYIYIRTPDRNEVPCCDGRRNKFVQNLWDMVPMVLNCSLNMLKHFQTAQKHEDAIPFSLYTNM